MFQATLQNMAKVLMLGFLFTINTVLKTTASCSIQAGKLDFDTSAFLGNWFLIKHHTDSFVDNVKCVQAEVKEELRGRHPVNLNYYNTKTSKQESNEVMFRRTYTSTEGRFVWTTPGLYRGSEGTVVETDYTNYAVLHTCFQTGMFNTTYEAWSIISRTLTLDGDIMSEAEKLLPKGNYTILDQFECEQQTEQEQTLE